MSLNSNELRTVPLPPAEVFISYARREFHLVKPVTDQLAELGITLWLDLESIKGAENFAESIRDGIKHCRIVIVMCTGAALGSRNVQQEIKLAWKYERPCLPLLLESVNFPKQIEYFLEGFQWIDVVNQPTVDWLSRIVDSLTTAGVTMIPSVRPLVPAGPSVVDGQPPPPVNNGVGFRSLRSLASFSDRIWPIFAYQMPHAQPAQPGLNFRDLGTLPRHQFQLGSRLGLVVDAERAGHLLLLDEGTTGAIYCLSPSWFVANASIDQGLNYLPPAGSQIESFQLTGNPGRETLLAIVTDKPVPFDWMPPDPQTPARKLSQMDLEQLSTYLHQLDPKEWVALATSFDIMR